MVPPIFALKEKGSSDPLNFQRVTTSLLNQLVEAKSFLDKGFHRLTSNLDTYQSCHTYALSWLCVENPNVIYILLNYDKEKTEIIRLHLFKQDFKISMTANCESNTM